MSTEPSYVAACDTCRFVQTCATRREAVQVAADHMTAHPTHAVSVERVIALGGGTEAP
jgi:hypothetical protein